MWCYSATCCPLMISTNEVLNRLFAVCHFQVWLVHTKLMCGHIKQCVHFVTWLPWLNAKWHVPLITNGVWAQRDSLIEACWTHCRGKRFCWSVQGRNAKHGFVQCDIDSDIDVDLFKGCRVKTCWRRREVSVTFSQLAVPALCCLAAEAEAACDFAVGADQPLSGTQIERPKQRLCSCCIMNVLMSLSRLRSPAGVHPSDPYAFFFFCSNSLTQHHSAKFSFKVLPGIYFEPIKQVGGRSGAQACSDFSVSVDSNVMLHFKSEFTYVAHSSDLTVPRKSDFSFSNSHHGRVWSAAEECFPHGGDERWSSLLSGTFQGRKPLKTTVLMFVLS